MPGNIRELVIIRIALLNRASYEVDQHAPLALSEGITPHQLSKLEHWESSAAFNARQRIALTLTDAMTLQVDVGDDVFAQAATYFDKRALVELVATIASYNMVSRFLQAMQIQSGDKE